MTRASLVRRYGSALRDFVERRDGASLRDAQDLGVLALRSGLGVFDLARLHGEIVSAQARGDCEENERVKWAELFLLDALAPFESARRGLPEAYLKLGQLNETLVQRNRALADFALRQDLTEEALRVSKARSDELFSQASSLRADVRQHSARLILAQEEERKRVSRELHDEIGQVLAAVNIGLAVLKKQAGHDGAFQQQIAAAQGLLEQSMESVHRFARELRPELLERLGPYEAIRTYLADFGDRTGIAASIRASADLSGLDGPQEIVLFRVAQECLTNVAKHAHATRVEVRFARGSAGVCMEVRDNGQAFSVADALVESDGQRLGLRGMQERVKLVRGEFSIDSSVGRGTWVRVQFPLVEAGGARAEAEGTKRLRTKATL